MGASFNYDSDEDDSPVVIQGHDLHVGTKRLHQARPPPLGSRNTRAHAAR